MRVRLFHQERAIGLHARAIAAAEQSADRLPVALPRMSHRAMSMPLIVWVRVPPRPIQKVFWCSFSETRSGSSAFSPMIERLQNLQPRLDEPAIGEDAAIAGDPGIGMDGDHGVDRIFRLDFRRPAALRALAEKRRRLDRRDAAWEAAAGLGCGVNRRLSSF